MKAHLSLALCLLLLLHLGACVPQHEPEGRGTVTAFVHVNVVLMDRERVLEDQTVVVEGERIRAIGPAERLQPPHGSAIIDGRDKYLMPGLADMHVHVIEEDQLLLFIANGVTTVRNMWGEPKHLEWRERINASDLLGPAIYTAGAIVDGDPPGRTASRR